MDYLVEFSRAAGIPVTEVTGRGRMRRQTDARHLYWELLHEYGYSYNHIATIFNRLNHSTVMHGVRSVEQLLEAGDKKVMKLYGQTKQFFEMSRKHNAVEIIPPSHVPFNMSKEFEAGGFRCPSCSGRGGFECAARDLGIKILYTCETDVFKEAFPKNKRTLWQRQVYCNSSLHGHCHCRFSMSGLSISR